MNLDQLIYRPDCEIITGLRGASPAWFAATAFSDRPVCCILPDEQMVAGFEQDLQLFSTQPVFSFPGYEIPPYTPLSPDQHTTAARLSALYRASEGSSSFILVISIEALLRRVIPRQLLHKHAELLIEGEDCDVPALRTSLSAMGYEHCALVKSYGDFSVRGGVVDIYPPPFFLPNGVQHDGPIRLDFFGDTIETIRPFDPLSQRSEGQIEEAVILPVSDIMLDGTDRQAQTRVISAFRSRAEQFDWSAEKTVEITDRLQNGLRFAGIEFFLPLFSGTAPRPSATILEYIPENSALLLIDPESIAQQTQLIWERIQSNYHSACQAASPCLPPEELFIPTGDLGDILARYKRSAVTDFANEQTDPRHIQTADHRLLKQEISLNRRTQGILKPLASQLNTWLDSGDRVVVCCRSSHRRKTLAELLDHHSFAIAPIDAPLDLDHTPNLDSNTLNLCDAPLTRGFSMPEKRLHLLSESELFGEMRLGKKRRRITSKGAPVNFTELQDGDIVVHREHGLGLYRGLVTIEMQEITNDFMFIEYRDGDKLYVPVDRLNQISRYEGLSDRQPKIDKLGAQSWKTTKKKVSDEVWKVAQELLTIYAKREMRSGKSFSMPGGFFRELEESFPFDETQGQYRAINDTITDLTSERPMDRLICGDVGYGKTEVAIRAAFKVVEDGYQAAVLVPTTVLAEQHAKTFRERLGEFPVRIECINRFRSSKQQKEIIADLARGEIDVIIGTHRLLSKDVTFRQLGLLIIDEEHRFGVTHKEKIKRIKAEVDVLTLTATPIPRTLQLSLLGIRDLSVISTPPEHRRPVKTFVARYDELVIKEAVSRELVRGGQVFVVHNRVKSIHRMAQTIQQLVPQARVAIAHGQMAGKELEEIMVAFVNQKIDVLVSTTIIESGLDIPSANTIIINRADRLGLAEIYQLRGRVGRSSTQSFAYLLVPSLDQLSKDSRERLRALMEYNELGGGFKLAMSDLQIRGGGNLLGVSQSGHIAAIGYDLYLDLLQKTVADLKSQQAAETDTIENDSPDPEINLRISAYIPDSYIADIGQRYIMYRRIAALGGTDGTNLEDLQDELIDRYGTLPEEVKNLLRIVALKKSLAPLKITKLEQGTDSLVFTFREDTPIIAQQLLTYLQDSKKRLRLLPDGRLVVPVKTTDPADFFPTIDAITRELAKFTYEQA